MNVNRWERQGVWLQKIPPRPVWLGVYICEPCTTVKYWIEKPSVVYCKKVGSQERADKALDISQISLVFWSQETPHVVYCTKINKTSLVFKSGHDYLEILPDEAEVAMNRPLVEIPLLGTDSGKYLRGHANRSFTCHW